MFVREREISFFHLSDRQGGCFHILAAVNNTQSTWVCRYPFKILSLVLLGSYPEAGLLDRSVILCLTFRGASTHPRVLTPGVFDYMNQSIGTEERYKWPSLHSEVSLPGFQSIM